MDRGEVIERVVLLPMRIKLQREGDRMVAVLPGWQLPSTGLLVEGATEAEAIQQLERRMEEFWGEP